MDSGIFTVDEIRDNARRIEAHVELQRQFVAAVVLLCDSVTEGAAMEYAEEVRRLLSAMPRVRAALGRAPVRMRPVSGF
jgi:hypothetical protein